MDIVLDLDETLVNTQERTEFLCELNILTDPKLIKFRTRIYHMNLEDIDGPGCGTKDSYWGIIRPGVKEFLEFCFKYFRYVIVWSAGIRSYVEAIVDYLFRDLSKPHYVFSRDKCIQDERGTVKPLVRMYEAVNKKYGDNLMNETTTLALDDTVSTFSENINNGIKIPAYKVSPTLTDINRSDTRLQELTTWLKANEGAKDVRTLDKTRIFI